MHSIHAFTSSTVANGSRCVQTIFVRFTNATKCNGYIAFLEINIINQCVTNIFSMFRYLYYISIFVISTSTGARLVVATNRMRNVHLALAILVTFIRNAVGYSQTPSIIRADNVIYLATAHIVTSRIDGQTFGIGSAIFAQIYVGHTFTGCLVQVCVQRALTQARPTNRIVANAIVGEATVLSNSFTESVQGKKMLLVFCLCIRGMLYLLALL